MYKCKVLTLNEYQSFDVQTTEYQKIGSSPKTVDFPTKQNEGKVPKENQKQKEKNREFRAKFPNNL